MSDQLRFTEVDAKIIHSLKLCAEYWKEKGDLEQVFELYKQMLAHVNMVTLEAITNDDFENGEHFVFSDIPVVRPGPGENKIFNIDIGLIAGSPLAQDILAVLKKHKGEAK